MAAGVHHMSMSKTVGGTSNQQWLAQSSQLQSGSNVPPMQVLVKALMISLAKTSIISYWCLQYFLAQKRPCPSEFRPCSNASKPSCAQS